MITVFTYTPLLVKGAGMTIAAWFLVGCMSIVAGTLLGIVSCNYVSTPRIRICVKVYTFIAKGIPAYVQILMAYFVIPAVLGISMPGFVAATCALAFCSSGYVTEIVRSALNALPRGQWQACAVLGYSTRNTLTRIILPQAARISGPALLGELEQTLKSTALFATIGVTELTRAGMNIISRELNPIPVYCTVAIVYLALSGLLQIGMYYIQSGGFNDSSN